MASIWTGIFLAVLSGVFIGVSFICTRYALTRRTDHGSNSHSYLGSGLWWIGMILMAIGEVSNFSAYSFASAIIVTPFGSVSVIVSTILATVLLKEECTRNTVLGIILCIIGTTGIIIHAPEEFSPHSIDEIFEMVYNSGFLLYAGFATFTSLFLGVFMAEKYGKKNLLVYISICSLIGSITVVSCKILGTAIRLTLTEANQMNRVFPYFCASVCVFCIVVTLNYFNKALDTFETSIVTPVYYVGFTSCTVIGSSILYETYKQLDFHSLLSIIASFLSIFIGIVLLKTEKQTSVDDSAAYLNGKETNFIGSPNELLI